MDVNIGLDLLDGIANVDVGFSGVTGVYPTLQTDFDRTSLPGVPGAGLDIGQGQVVCRFTKFLGAASLGKRAELALESTDIRVVDVPVDYVTDSIAIHRLAQFICGCTQDFLVPATRVEQRDDFFFP